MMTSGDKVDRDKLHIDLAEDWEIRYWTRELRCTEAQLRDAVARVGPRVGDVRGFLATAEATSRDDGGDRR